jgi:hypothetical protein
MKTKYYKQMAMASVLALGMSGGVLAVNGSPGTSSTPISKGGITPYIISGANPGGNRTCAEVGSAFFGNANYYLCSSDRVNYKDGDFDNTFADITGKSNEYGNCSDNAIKVTTDGTLVAFTAEPDGVGAAIVKGSNDANVYVYNPQALSDSGLASPVNASGGSAGLSNLTFCWNPIDQGGNGCFADETAWAAGARYVNRGNWATYTPYTTKPVILYAGQTMNAGSVSFSTPVDNVVTIEVTLNAGWRFALQPVGENPDMSPIYDNNLKVQDYSVKPSGNPAPGLFLWKKVCNGSVCTIDVPKNNYYGVHVDVERKVDCPKR